MCADGVGAREWMEMGGEKGLSERGCADGCGWCERKIAKVNGWQCVWREKKKATFAIDCGVSAGSNKGRSDCSSIFFDTIMAAQRLLDNSASTCCFAEFVKIWRPPARM